MLEQISFLFSTTGHIIELIVLIISICALVTVLYIERRRPTAAYAWALLVIFLPIIGAVIYVFLGRHLYEKHLFNKKLEADKLIEEYAKEVIEAAGNKDDSDETGGYNRYMLTLTKTDNNAVASENNAVTIYRTGEEKFAAMRDAILGAKHHIHIEYFIIRNDELGQSIVNLLAQKAKEGVEVRALFDSGGVPKGTKHFFAPIRDAGGDVRIFFKSCLPISPRINFHDHRKILVIDGIIGFIGGFNIGDEYLGKGHLGRWRDTHFKIQGAGVAPLQLRFLADWNYTAKDRELNALLDSPYFPDELMNEYGKSIVQIASSGPDTKNRPIYSGYVKLISIAQKSIYIHTPYFVPDEGMIEALRLAALSGVDVRIVIPCKPDHPFIYWANRSYLWDLIEAGVKAYEYKDGFIHSKASIYDGKVFSVGTANWDIRSFNLNFETQAFVYDEELGASAAADYLEELKTECREITLDDYKNRSFKAKIMEAVSRLFTPLL